MTATNHKIGQLRESILALLDQREPGKTICPSEAARAVGGEEETTWRALMEPARQAAQQLAREGKIIITQRGRRIDPEHLRGAIRLRLP